MVWSAGGCKEPESRQKLCCMLAAVVGVFVF